jgi:ribosome maturation factor RimP
MDLNEQIAALIGPTVETLGYELVRVRMQGGARHATLQIMAERCDRRAMLVDDCARLSRAISNVLDAADPIASEYMLEVSSPGIDRPLIKRVDYERFLGHEAKLETALPIDGRKRFQGILTALEGDSLSIDVDGSAVSLPLDQIKHARLVLTDRLIAAAEQESTAANIHAEADGAPPNHV